MRTGEKGTTARLLTIAVALLSIIGAGSGGWAIVREQPRDPTSDIVRIEERLKTALGDIDKIECVNGAQQEQLATYFADIREIRALLTNIRNDVNDVKKMMDAVQWYERGRLRPREAE